MGWFENAARALRKRVEPAPQSYDIRCTCGGRLTGNRFHAAQKVHCPLCQARFLVLPASPYPPPAEPKRGVALAAPQTLTPPRDAAPEEPRASPAEKTLQQRAKRRRTKATGAAAPAETQRGAAEAAEAIRQQAPTPSMQARRAVEWLTRRVFTPVRLVLGMAAAVLIASIWWFVHAGRLEQARQTIDRSTRLAEQALAEGLLEDAATHYEQVVAAIDLLELREPRSLAARQVAMEAMAAGRLAPASLVQIVEEASASLLAGTADIWPDVFRSTYRNQWVVLEAPVERIAAPGGTAFAIDYPIKTQIASGILEGNLALFERLAWSEGAPTRVIVAAQLDDCRLDSGVETGWIITLRPDTAFLWTRQETYRLLGFEPDEATIALLEAQRHLAESSR